MVVVQFVGLVLWTVVVVRLVAYRATLRLRVFGRFAVIGMLFALTVLPLADRAIIPYGQSSGYKELLDSLVRLAIVLVPVVLVVSRRETLAALTIADVFGIAFSIGFGADATVIGLTVAKPGPHLNHIALFPPFAYLPPSGSGHVAAGMAYWVALVAVGFAIVSRFFRRRPVAIGVGGLLFLIAALQQAAVVFPDAKPFRRGLLHVFRSSGSTAFVVIVAVVAASVGEVAWIRGRASAPGPYAERRGDLRRRVASGDIGGILVALAAGRRRRQLETFSVEVKSDPTLAATAELVTTSLVAPPDETRSIGLDGHELLGWCRLAWAPLAVVVVAWVLPRAPGVSKWFWRLRYVQWHIFSMPLTVLDTVLITVLTWQVIRIVPAPASMLPERAVPGIAHRLLMSMGAGVVILVLAFVKVEHLYPPRDVFSLLLRREFLAWTRPQVATLYLLIGISVTSAMGERRSEWLARSLRQRREVVVANALTLGTALVFTWITVATYAALVPVIQRREGATAFNHFKANGNDVVAIVTMLMCAILGFVLFLVLRRVRHQVERFLLDSDDRSTPVARPVRRPPALVAPAMEPSSGTGQP